MFLEHFPIPKGASRELEEEFSRGHVVMEQGVMILNYKRVVLG